jgi:hypothetical protein
MDVRVTDGMLASSWRGKHSKDQNASRYLQSATTTLEPCSTSLNCDGDEISTVFDMLVEAG